MKSCWTLALTLMLALIPWLIAPAASADVADTHVALVPAPAPPNNTVTATTRLDVSFTTLRTETGEPAVVVRDDQGQVVATPLLFCETFIPPPPDRRIFSCSGAPFLTLPPGSYEVEVTISTPDGDTEVVTLTVTLVGPTTTGELSDLLGTMGQHDLVDRRLVRPLRNQLRAAARAFASGKEKQGCKHLEDFVRRVERERGRRIDAAAAEALLRGAQAVCALEQAG